ncbi:putative disease resistance RPP13-like protein 1 [Sesbania bispinosa]|nr:putative disease resistance RPP13-like protein 1 [Sesbania bispinosa]
MAMAFVGEAFLSASVEKAENNTAEFQVVLNDAEEKQITNPAVKEWLDELRDALYDADDLLDEINSEALRCKLEAGSQSQPISDQVLKFLSSTFKRFFWVQKAILGLKEGASGRVWHGTPTSSVVDESAIYGRDDDKRYLKITCCHKMMVVVAVKLEWLPLWPWVDLVKTTLAKLLYNDHEVKEKFDLKA